MFYLPFKLQKGAVKKGNEYFLKINFSHFVQECRLKIILVYSKNKLYFLIAIITTTFLFLCKVGQKINFAYSPSLTALGLVCLPRFRMDLCAALITYVSLGVMAILPIIIGSLCSVQDEAQKEKEHLSTNDAYMFPVIGSVFLLSFYLVFKYLPQKYINYVITAYFAMFGCVSVTKLVVRTASFVPFIRTFLSQKFDTFTCQVKKAEDEILNLSITYFDIAVGILSAALTGYYVWSKNWVANNVFGEAFATTAITLIGLESFRVGWIMLGGLFAYDIFWVFGTNVMVSVAKNFNAPIKLLFPKDVFNYSGKDFALLGLGDIVVPGIFIALCLKFDRHIHLKGNKNGVEVPPSRPYFFAGLIAYVIGLTATVFVMHTFKAAQPALLYLSPACGLAPLIIALFRGELRELFLFNAGHEQEHLNEKEPTNNKKED